MGLPQPIRAFNIPTPGLRNPKITPIIAPPRFGVSAVSRLQIPPPINNPGLKHLSMLPGFAQRGQKVRKILTVLQMMKNSPFGDFLHRFVIEWRFLVLGALGVLVSLAVVEIEVFVLS